MKNREGFTLIEILIYIGIFSLIIGGLLLVTFGIVQGSGRLQSNVVVNEEATFVIRKLYWAFAGATGITVPSAGRLEITNPSFPAGEDPVFELNSGKLMFGRGSGALVQLTTDDVEFSSLVFSKIVEAGKPDALRAQFTISSRSSNMSFDVIKYLRE